jgi:hypothetical protein
MVKYLTDDETEIEAQEVTTMENSIRNMLESKRLSPLTSISKLVPDQDQNQDSDESDEEARVYDLYGPRSDHHVMGLIQTSLVISLLFVGTICAIKGTYACPW